MTAADRLWVSYEAISGEIPATFTVLAARGYIGLMIGSTLDPSTDETAALNITVGDPPAEGGPFSDGIRYS